MESGLISSPDAYLAKALTKMFESAAQYNIEELGGRGRG